MSSKDTRWQARLNKLMESRIHGDMYVRFGGEFLETYHRKRWQGAGFLSYAEIASLLVGQELKIGHDPAQHAAYVQDWIRVLTDSPFEIHMAAADAEKIFNYLLAFEQQRTIAARVQDQDLLPEKQSAKSTQQLFIGEEIAYRQTLYKVEVYLKQGRLRMQDLTSGNSFILSRSDGLYQSLTEAKLIQHAAKSQDSAHAERSSEPLAPYQLNR